MTDLENLRHAEARGKLLKLLAEDYTSRMTSVGTLRSALDLCGISVTKIDFHLTYLEDSGFVRLWRTKDMPGFRADRHGEGNPDAIGFAKVTPRGIQLIDGNIPEDPKVKF